MINRIKTVITKKYFLALFLAAGLGISATSLYNDRLFEIAKNMELFASVFKALNTHYVDQVDPSILMKTGIDAMVNSLDPYTNYITESQIQSYRISDDDKFQGVGAEAIKIGDKFYFNNILEGGAVQTAKIIAGDEIVSIGGTPLKDKTADEVMSSLRGAAGSTVSVSVKSFLDGELKILDLKRDEVNISNVPYSNIVSPGVGYIQLTTFTENAAANIIKAFKKLKEQDPNLKGVMLDLRHNGGGLLREAISISNIWLPQGEELVTTKGKLKDKDQSYKTFTAPQDLDIPVSVLVDGKSASASEIVSGVLQDYDRAVIIGQRTYGKGLVQNIFELGYNSRVKVTISKYYIPSGRCIQGVEYENGEPVDIPDNKRTKFKTKNGREVLDGGGVTPDLKIALPEKPELVTNLLNKHVIYQFANEYFKKNQTPPTDISSFKFLDYDDFIKFTAKMKFGYKIGGEEYLDSLKTKLLANKDLASISKSQIQAIENSIDQQKQKDFSAYKNMIVDEIEREIAARYAFEKGKTLVKLRNDNEVAASIALLNDTERYKSILKKK